MKNTRVLVTGIGGGGHGEQILKALKMANIPLDIIGADMTRISRGLSEVKTSFLLPPASSSEYIDVLIEKCKELDIEVLFHGSEPELRKMSEEREKIRGAGIFLPINNKQVIDTCMDKFKTVEFLKEHGFRYPKTYHITSLDDCNKVESFPIVLKPSVGSGGSANTYIVQTFEELAFCCKQMLQQYSEFIAQEYVGTPDDEYTVGVLSDMEGEIVNSIAVHRMIRGSLGCRIKVPNISENKSLGKDLVISSGISQGRIGKYPEVTKKCEKIALAIGSKGPLNIQCRYVNGEVYLFEINPRYSGTTSFRAMVGLNEPEIMIKYHYLGLPIERNAPFREGYILRGLDETFIADE
ncbi:ATP-grasp domain-containing protein [Roseivirga thermotolerans]|uniref:ATP-grasp domain-containing protein n=1 Tax=Roseivirga thermotolerans TaxID=1758176 RepID=UPI00273E392B|nr:ATP-grasp domain-containing protein [Roseivirga thermotolerans]